MLKNILLIFTVMVTTVVAAQTTASPYSLGGLGDVTFRGNAIDRLMGGLVFMQTQFMRILIILLV